jgi:hypothetical protein
MEMPRHDSGTMTPSVATPKQDFESSEGEPREAIDTQLEKPRRASRR